MLSRTGKLVSAATVTLCVTYMCIPFLCVYKKKKKNKKMFSTTKCKLLHKI